MDETVSVENDTDKAFPPRKESVIQSSAARSFGDLEPLNLTNQPTVIHGPTRCEESAPISNLVDTLELVKQPIATRLKIRMLPSCVTEGYKYPKIGQKRRRVIQRNPASILNKPKPNIIHNDEESPITNGLKFKNNIIDPDAETDSEAILETAEHNVDEIDGQEMGSKRHIERRNWYAPKLRVLSSTEYDSDVIIIEDELSENNYEFVSDPYLSQLQPQESTQKRHKRTKKKRSIRPSISVMIPSEKVHFRGTCLTRGDIVSVVDTDNSVYYAQIRGFLQDQFNDKSALVTWLLPTQCSPKDEFDPETYIVGPRGEIPRKLECFEFVCHAPNECFEMGPYSEFLEKPVCGYLMTKQGPILVPVSPVHSSDSD